MSCGDRTRPVNPRQPGVPGRWVLPRRTPSRSAICVHTWQYRNALGIVGGPVVKACTGCDVAHYPTWVPDAAVPLALPAAPARRPWPFLVGESEWADLLRERGVA